VRAPYHHVAGLPAVVVRGAERVEQRVDVVAREKGGRVGRQQLEDHELVKVSDVAEPQGRVGTPGCQVGYMDRTGVVTRCFGLLDCNITW
jgi:hypothetical protein